MALFGWVLMLCLSLYLTFGIVGINVCSLAFSGKSVGRLANTVGMIVLIAIWYIVFEFVPFTLSANQ